VNNLYIQRGELCWAELGGFWSDAGTFESLFRANAYWAQKTTVRCCEDFTRYFQSDR
jgi:glucose-1-phosphate thymidylyltransferase